ncbi:MAG: DUF3293 domain-containing protein [Elusimicrobiota bacterium]
MDDRPNPDHLKAYFTADVPASGLPRRFGIVTGYNAESRIAPDDANMKADEELRRELVAAGLPHFRVTGGSRDDSHREPGYGISADSPEPIRTISRRFRQEAFFWVEDGVVYVINTEGTRRHRVAEWSERFA